MSVHCAEYGAGMPVLALHGAGVDHREVAGALEPVFSEIPNYRRLYPDLPGMGLTPAPGTITSNDDVLDLLLASSTTSSGMNRSFSWPLLRQLQRPRGPFSQTR